MTPSKSGQSSGGHKEQEMTALAFNFKDSLRACSTSNFRSDSAAPLKEPPV